MLNAVSLGQMGAVLVEADTFPTGNYIGILCVTDVVFTSFTGQLTDSGGALTVTTFPAGMYIPVPFTTAVVSSGTALAIKGGRI